MSIVIEVDFRDLDKIKQFVSGLEHLDASDLMASIAAEGKYQTERRIGDEKTAPDGTPWTPIKDDDHPILVESGRHLLGYMGWVSTADEARWGSSWEFAHVHQQGAVIPAKAGGKHKGAKATVIPARPFLGLSDDNRTDIGNLITDYFGRLVR